MWRCGDEMSKMYGSSIYLGRGRTTGFGLVSWAWRSVIGARISTWGGGDAPLI